MILHVRICFLRLKIRILLDSVITLCQCGTASVWADNTVIIAQSQTPTFTRAHARTVRFQNVLNISVIRWQNKIGPIQKVKVSYTFSLVCVKRQNKGNWWYFIYLFIWWENMKCHVILLHSYTNSFLTDRSS